MTVEDIEKRIKGMATRALVFGALVGLLGGFAFGFAVGYSQGDRTIVIPLADGIET
jgi:hypothetical protein